MIQADDGFSSREPAKSAGNVNEISSGLAASSVDYLTRYSAAALVVRLEQIDDSAGALNQMIDMLRASTDIDGDVSGMLLSISMVVSHIREMAMLDMERVSIQ